MINRTIVSTILFASFTLLPVAPALAQGEIIITQVKALAGNVTPGDAPGFPINLTQPGSYQLASNLSVPSGAIGIAIQAHDVTLDLKGFRIYGSNVAWHGIVGSMNSTTIRNGTVALFQYNGIYITGEYAMLGDMRVVENGRHGISVGNYAGVRTSTSANNGGTGILCNICSVEGNVVIRNGGFGISFGAGMALGNMIYGNTLAGISGNGSAGFADNTSLANNGANPEVTGVVSMHPNFCISPACP